MEALQCDASKGELSLETVPVPVVTAPDDVIIEVGYAGLCGTDLHIMSVSSPLYWSPRALVVVT